MRFRETKNEISPNKANFRIINIKCNTKQNHLESLFKGLGSFLYLFTRPNIQDNSHNVCTI